MIAVLTAIPEYFFYEYTVVTCQHQYLVHQLIVILLLLVEHLSELLEQALLWVVDVNEVVLLAYEATCSILKGNA